MESFRKSAIITFGLEFVPQISELPINLRDEIGVEPLVHGAVSRQTPLFWSLDRETLHAVAEGSVQIG